MAELYDSDLYQKNNISDTNKTIFHIALLRNFSISRGAELIKIKSQKAKAILAYLLLNGTGLETRDRICNLFWSETSVNKARDSLRQVVSIINKNLNIPQATVFDASRNELRIDAASFEVDILMLIRKLEQRETHDLLLSSSRILESLLADFDDLDAEFRIWLHIQRQTLQDRIIRMLEDILSISERSNCKKICQALLNLDPTHESACRELMRVHAQNGDIGGALRVYKSLWQVLDEEYGEEPSRTTQELIAAIKLGNLSENQEADMQAANYLDPSIDRIGMARQENVLLADKQRELVREPKQKLVIGIDAFITDGVNEDKGYLVQGFRHELIACLIRFRDLAIIDLKAKTASAIADNSMVSHYTISTTVYQHGDTLILILTLQESITGAYVWSDRFELRLDSWFAVQHMIVRRIAIALNVNLSAERLAQIASKPDVSLDIYDRWLRAENLTLHFKPETHERASEIFRSIIETTRSFPSAYIGLVELENTRHLVSPGLFRSQETLQHGLALAKKALQLGPLYSRAHLCLAWSYAMTGQYEQAVYSYLDACNLNENDPWILVSCAQGLAFCDQKEHASQLAGQALSLNISPSPAHWGYQVGIQFLCGDYQASVKACELANDLIFNLPAWKIAALFHMGRRDDAVSEAEFFVEFMRANWAVSSEPTPLAITRWLLQCFPIRRLEDWYRLQTGLKGAGLPVPESPEY